MSVKKEQQYIITELELKTFHMAAILAGGTNGKAQEIVDGIRKRKISETMEAVEQPLTQAKAAEALPDREICPYCGGSGTVYFNKESKCGHCNGTGKLPLA